MGMSLEEIRMLALQAGMTGESSRKKVNTTMYRANHLSGTEMGLDWKIFKKWASDQDLPCWQ